MRVIGITGGVGSGKSEVLKFLKERYGAAVCQMDETAKELQRSGTECFSRIVEAFGREMIGADGELDRGRLGACVFSDPEKLKILNRIVHPAVLDAVREDIKAKAAAGVPVYVVEAALLPDAGAELCDELWYIYAREDVRSERLKASRHYTDEKIRSMIASQPSEEAFRRACTVVIDNSGPFENTMRQIGDRI
ncbi:MAG TPA: dephospho-CoA kinase [Candidatus Mediterraneibacter norfolkensis]|nr:dephospho-CoA kinase [Candidatus Mediterraneibacter norfolkensis]